MSTSIKFKFIPAKNKNKAGIISLQLIHNRKVKRINTRFRLFPSEWDKQKKNIRFDHADTERQIYLQSIKNGMDNELKQLHELIHLLEKKSAYTVNELYGLYISKSFGGFFSPFIDYVANSLKADNRQKTASNCLTARQSFERFLFGQDVLIDKIDNRLIHKYESHLKSTGYSKKYDLLLYAFFTFGL